MKPHLVVKTRASLPQVADRAPYWQRFIRDKSVNVTHFHPAFDRELATHGVRFWVTTEYQPAAGDHAWSPDEVAAGLNRIYRIVLQDDFDLPDELVRRVRLIPDFEFVRPIRVGQAPLPRPSVQMGVEILSDHSREQIHLRQAHLFGRGDPRINVAVLDTGVNLDHPEVRRRVVKRADFVNLDGLDTTDFIGDYADADDVPEDEVGHGTHVAGIIAGEGLRMPVGVAPECGIIAVRTLATMKAGDHLVGAGVVDNINVAFKWAVDNGAHVINASLGIRHTGGGLPHEEVIRYALSRGVSVVAAAGNDGTDEKYYPGALPGVIAVGAADEAGSVAPFSSYGAPVWLIAPGTNVFSSYAGGRYESASGTSQASPFVAGAVALLKSQALARGVRLGDAQVKEILRHTSDKPDQRPRTPRSGYGMLNLLDACRMLNYLIEGDGARSAA
jgi:thermitase